MHSWKVDATRVVFCDSLSAEVKQAGTYKRERIITTPQQASIRVTSADVNLQMLYCSSDHECQKPVLNFCANNYLGLSDDPVVVESAKTVCRDVLFFWLMPVVHE